MVWVPGLVVSGARDNTMSSPGPGQSHSDLGHSDTPETHEETSGASDRRQRAVTSDEHHGAQPGDHGGAGDHRLGEHSHSPGGGASGRGSGRALP